MAEQFDEKKRFKQRMHLILLVLVFAGPMIVAWVMYANVTDWSTFSKKNRGELIHPARPLNTFSLQTTKGEAFTLASLHEHWNVIILANSACAESCRDELYKSRQSRLAQGKEMSRVKRVLVLTDNGTLSNELTQFIHEQHPDLLVVNGDTVTGLIDQFSMPGDRRYRVFIVDPLGNLMMAYPSGFAAKSLLKDLSRLLHISQIG